MHAPPPYLNELGECLTFSVEGDLRAEKAIHPTQFARDLKQTWADQRTRFMEIDRPELEPRHE